MSRIQRENERYLARVAASMEAERTAAAERRRRRQERDDDRKAREELRRAEAEARRADREARQAMRDQYEDDITNKNNDYGAFWVNSMGTGVAELMYKMKNGVPLGVVEAAMRVKTYDAAQRQVVVAALPALVAQAGGFPELRESRGQVCYHGKQHVSAIVYNFLRSAWHATAGSSMS